MANYDLVDSPKHDMVTGHLF
jgi:hypothetical protein